MNSIERQFTVSRRASRKKQFLASLPVLVILHVLAGTAQAVDTGKILPVADGAQNRWYHRGDATSSRLHAEYAEGMANGRRIVMKFDLRGIGPVEIRGAKLWLFGGRIGSCSSVDTRVYRYANNNWNESSNASIPFPDDANCTFLAQKNITASVEPGIWHEFDIGANLGSRSPDGFLSLAVRNFDSTFDCSISFISRNSVTWDGSKGKEPFLVFRTWSDSGVADGSFPGGELGGWSVSPGAGTVQVRPNPYQADDYLAELKTGSAVTLWQHLDTPMESFDVVFRHEFRTMTGTLQVWLADRDGNSTLLGTIEAPAEPPGSLAVARLTVDNPDLLGLDHARLSFALDGPTGSTFWLDDVSFAEPGEPDQAPGLRIARESGGMVLLAWPDPSPGYQLRRNVDLAADVWTDVMEVPAVVGGEKQATVPIDGPRCFFRVVKP